jgi:hypothetical protein
MHVAPKLALILFPALLATACAQTRLQVAVPERSPPIKKIELIFEQPDAGKDQMTFRIKHPLGYREVYSTPGDDLIVKYNDPPVSLHYPGTGTGHDRVSITPPANLPAKDPQRRIYRMELNVNDSVDESTCSTVAREPYLIDIAGTPPARVCVVTYAADTNACDRSPARASSAPLADVKVVSVADGAAAPEIDVNCSALP